MRVDISRAAGILALLAACATQLPAQNGGQSGQAPGQTGNNPGQSGTAGKGNKPTHIVLGQLPVEASVYVKQLGKRLLQTGSEAGTYTGTYTDSTGTFSFSLIWQNPGLADVTILSPTKQTLKFDGSTTTSSANAILTAVQQDILQTFTDDYPEAFFFAMSEGAGYRMLGARFRNDDGKTPSYTGPYYAVYQKVSPAASSKTTPITKLFVFDTATGLLNRTTYMLTQGTSQTPTEVQFTNWQKSGTEMYPGKITRVTPAGTEFTIVLQSAAFSQALDVQNFKNQ